MAIINDDKKVLEGRRDELENVQVPLRDQIPQKLKRKLDELKIGDKIVDVWHKGNAQRAEWLGRQETYLQDWDEHLVSSSEGPFEHSSSLHIPMPLIVAKTMHARFYQAIMSVDPPFTAKARTVASVERASMVQQTLRYALSEWCNNRKGVAEVIDAWLWNWVTVGSAFLKLRWTAEYTRFIDVENIEVPGIPIFDIDPETGEEFATPTVRTEEQEVKRTVKTFEGPVYDLVQAEDIVFQGGAGDLQKADIVIQAERLNASQLWSLADQKIFDEKAVRKVIKSGDDPKIADLNSTIKQSRANNRGVDSETSETELDSYRIFEAYLSVDVDGSGVNSEVICWVHENTKQILRATFLRRVHKDGLRPFYKIDFLRKPGQDYGTGLIEMLHPLSVEMDAMHNMRIDFGMLSTMPFGFYRPTSSIDPEILQLEPGSLIPVDNPQTDIFFPNLGNRTSFGFQEESALQNMVERLTGVSELSLGVLSSQQGAARTATGARALIGEANANLDIFLQRLNQGWKQALEGLLHMLQQRIPAGLSFRITGEAGDDYWTQIRSQEDIAGDFDIEIAPNTSQSNPSIRRELAATVLQITSNPLDMQLGIVTPAERYEAIKNFLKENGIKDVSRFIKKPLNQHIVATPQEEADMLLHGINIPVLPDMDHEGFIAFVQEIMGSDELLGQFDEQAVERLQAQAQAHAQMIQNLRQLEAQQRNQQQVQTNAALGTQQANSAPIGTGQNPGVS